MSQKQKKNKSKFKPKTRQPRKKLKNKHNSSTPKSPTASPTTSKTPPQSGTYSNGHSLSKSHQAWLPFGQQGPCAQLAECGACPLLPLTPADQHQWKLDNLHEYLAQYTCLESVKVSLDAILLNQANIDIHYRHSAKPSVRPGLNKQAHFKIGLYRPKSHDLVNLDNCLAQSPNINKLLASLRTLCPQAGLQAYQHIDLPKAKPNQFYKTQKQDSACRLRYVVIRQGESLTERTHSTLYLTLIVQNTDLEKLQKLVQLLRNQHAELSGVAVHENHLLGNAIFDFSKPSTLLWGEPALYHRLHLQDNSEPLTIQVSASSFTQVNPTVAERAYRKVVELLAPQAQDLAVDLYCGVGSIGLLLANQARLNGGPLTKLWGLEETQSSIDDAVVNATNNKIDEAEFILGKAEDQLDLLYKKIREEDDLKHNLIVALNPSRRGCHPNVLKAITRLKPRKIVYMSCHARTLSRDLSILSSLNYQAQDTILFDMFPGSFHYETVTSIIPHPSIAQEST